MSGSTGEIRTKPFHSPCKCRFRSVGGVFKYAFRFKRTGGYLKLYTCRYCGRHDPKEEFTNELFS